MAGYWSRSFFVCLWTSTWPISSHLTLHLGQNASYFASVDSQDLTYRRMKLRICQHYWQRFAGDCSSPKVDWNLRLYEANKARTNCISTTSRFKSCSLFFDIVSDVRRKKHQFAKLTFYSSQFLKNVSQTCRGVRFKNQF